MKYTRTQFLPPYQESKRGLGKINSADTDYLTRQGLEIYISQESNPDGSVSLRVREHYTVQDAELVEVIAIKSKFGEFMDFRKRKQVIEPD